MPYEKLDLLGTAYQLADDILDASGNEKLSGKTLGKDYERSKTTAFTVKKGTPENPISYINSLIMKLPIYLSHGQIT